MLTKSNRLTPDSILAASQKKKEVIEDVIWYPADDSTIYDIPENKVYLYNNANVKYGDINLSAYYIELDITKKEVFARGKVSGDSIIQKPVYKDSLNEYKLTTIRYNFKTGKALIEGLTMEQSGGFVNSNRTKKDSLGNFYLRNGQFTTDDRPDPAWYFRLTKAKFTEDKQVIAGPTYMVVEEVPTPLWIPFGFFPKNKKHSSGLLFPSFGEEKNRGFYMSKLGWYFAISDKLDLAIVGDIYSRGSWRGHLASQYRNRYKYNGNVELTFARNVMGEKDFINDYSKTKDFKVLWSHNQDPKANPYGTFSAQVNFSSSKFDKYNSYTTQDHLRTTKSSSISYRRKWDNPLFNFSAKLGHTQNSVDTTINLSLPSASFNIGRVFPFRKKIRSGKIKWYEKFQISYTSKIENRLHVKESELFSENALNGLKNGFQHNIPFSANFKLLKNITFTPSVNYQGNLFFSSIQKNWAEPTDTLSQGEVISERINGLKYIHVITPKANLSWNKQIFAMYSTKRPDKRFVALRHLITPRIGISYNPNLANNDIWYKDSVQVNDEGLMNEYSIFEESLYRPAMVRESSGSITFGFKNNIEMKLKSKNDTVNKTQKIKILESLDFSSSWDMFRETFNMAPIRMSGRTILFDNFNLNFGSTFDPYAIDSLGQRINKFEIAENQKLWRTTSANVSLGFQLPLKNSGQNVNSTQTNRPQSYATDPYGSYSYFNVPWQLRLDYSFRYSKPGLKENITQSLRFSGFVKLTPNWNIQFSSGYDFVAKEFTYTSATITRDLYSWEMSFHVIPFGTLQSFNFRLNIKNQLFKDIKIKKQKSWYDNDEF
ncbi:putative LPS assembly protein LptD [Bacteroidota bacterium]